MAQTAKIMTEKRPAAPDRVLTRIADYTIRAKIRDKSAHAIARYSLLDALACLLWELPSPECGKLGTLTENSGADACARLRWPPRDVRPHRVRRGTGANHGDSGLGAKHRAASDKRSNPASYGAAPRQTDVRRVAAPEKWFISRCCPAAAHWNRRPEAAPTLF